MQPAISVENLGKRYVVSHEQQRGGYRTMRESLAGIVQAPLRRLRGEQSTTKEAFWALQDVSFDVNPGEVVGIIGRNGAGKSTLLKVLSRITKPTSGQVRITGRVGSLLEVGTGFHPELTGRENVFLNGSILGMSRSEIAAKFDDIVQFSEVERFLDTPVKRYSSGMYVRLAFAVAAHLEPEILIVDEVLAVGDVSFQQKCFSKMAELKHSGRTVLVVSHNLGAILNICSSAINLENGQLMTSGLTEEQVAWYLNRLTAKSQTSLRDRTDREGDHRALVTDVRILNAAGVSITEVVCGEDVSIEVEWESQDVRGKVDYVALSCWTADGSKLFSVDNSMSGCVVPEGAQRFACCIPRLPLLPGTYQLNVLLASGGAVRDHIYSAATIDVIAGDFYRLGKTCDFHGGQFALNHSWRVLQ